MFTTLQILQRNTLIGYARVILCCQPVIILIDARGGGAVNSNLFQNFPAKSIFMKVKNKRKRKRNASAGIDNANSHNYHPNTRAGVPNTKGLLRDEREVQRPTTRYVVTV